MRKLQQSIKGAEGTMSSVDRKFSKENPDDNFLVKKAKAMYRAGHNIVADDKVMSNGNNVSQQTQVQNAINKVRAGLKSSILEVEKTKYKQSVSTNCASDSLDKLGIKHTFGKGAQEVT